MPTDSELQLAWARKTVPDDHIKRQRELRHREVLDTTAAQVAQARQHQHDNGIRRSVQLLDKPDNAVAEEALGNDHSLRYFGAAAHARGEAGVGGVEGEKVGGGAAEEGGKQDEGAKFAAVLQEHEVVPKLPVGAEQVPDGGINGGNKWQRGEGGEGA